MNKLPLDILDISKGQQYTFLDGSGNPTCSALLIQASGSRIDTANSQAIAAAVDKGMGAVGLWPESVNSTLKDMFGISTIGTASSSSYGFQVNTDKFTFAYVGKPVQEQGEYRNHTLAADAQIVAAFTPAGTPALWVARYGSGKTVFHTTTRRARS